MLDRSLRAFSCFLVPGIPLAPDGHTLSLFPRISHSSKDNEGGVGNDNRKGCIEGNKLKKTDQGQHKMNGQEKQSSHKPETNFE